MLCESFAINQKEFEQIFALDESVFALWDSDSNGNLKIDEEKILILILQVLLMQQNSFVFQLFIRVQEQRIKLDVIGLVIIINIVLFEFFDFNDNNYLEEGDI